MADYAHFHLDDVQRFCLTGIGPRPIRRTVMHPINPNLHWQYQAEPCVCECETEELADQLMEKFGTARRADLNSLNSVFDSLVCSWAMVGPTNLVLRVPSIHKRGHMLSEFRNWARDNCEDSICILSGTYKRRISFASESDFILGQMLFQRTYSK